MADYSGIFNPVGTIKKVVELADEESGGMYSDIFKTGAGMAMQGSSVVGSKLMELIEPLDKGRGAVSGARVEAFSTPSVTDERSFNERIVDAAKEGFDNPQFPKVPIPERFEGTAIGRVGEVGGGFAASVLEDPLTYTPGAVVSIPFRVSAALLQAAGKTKPVQAALESAPVRNVLESLNIYTGDAAKAKEIIESVRLESRGQEILSQRDMVGYNQEMQQIANNAGIEVSELKAGILQAAEANDFTKVKEISQEAVKFAGDERKFYEQILDAETLADTPTKDIMRRSEELGIEGYVPHIRNDTFTAKVKRLLSGSMGAQKQRGIAGTIEEINAQKGTTFFMDDPATLRTMRLRWHNQMMAADRAMTRASSEFGTAIGSNKGGKRLDTNGDPIPDDWVTLKKHAYPPQIGRVLNQQYQLLKSPAKANEVIKMYDEVQNWWKKYSLASRPAWHSRNAIGNFWNNYFIGGVKNPIVYGEAAAVQKAMQTEKGSVVERLDRLTGTNPDKNFKVSGTDMTREEIFNEAIKRGVYESGLYGQDLGQAAVTSSNIPLTTEWKGINKAFAAGKAVENNARLALFIDQIKKGKSLDEAGKMVRKTLFDYSDLSQFEKSYAKRLMPFYTWSRKNIPAQFEAVLKHPDRAQKLNLLIGNMQSGVQKIDENDVESWAKNQFPIFLNNKDSENYYTFVTAMSYLPTAELERVFQTGEYKGMISDMLSPVLKVPFELFMNQNYFRDDVIDYSQKGVALPLSKGESGEGAFPFRADTTKGSEEFLGIRVTPKEKHILSSIVLLSEVDRLNPFNVFGDTSSREEDDRKSWAGVPRDGQEMPESARWIRAMIGARVYKREKGSAERSEVFDMISTMKDLERKITSSKAARNPELMEHLRLVLENTLEGY